METRLVENFRSSLSNEAKSSITCQWNISCVNTGRNRIILSLLNLESTDYLIDQMAHSLPDPLISPLPKLEGVVRQLKSQQAQKQSAAASNHPVKM